MKQYGLTLSLLGILLFWQVDVEAMVYGASLENSQWHANGSELECRLVQPIPGYGDGIFSRPAGQGLTFHLRPNHRVLPEGEVQVSIEAPTWKPGVRSQPLTKLPTELGLASVKVPEPYAGQMLAALQRGLKPAVTSVAEQPVKVAVSSVNFQDSYSDYNRCLVALLPVSFEQIARSVVFFGSNQTMLSSQVKDQLNLIARYIKADGQIKKIYIDGHTDDTGPKKVNVNVSKRRAQMISSYLKKQGVPAKQIVTRYHADRYPVVKNENEENRARNRRVTLRLVAGWVAVYLPYYFERLERSFAAFRMSQNKKWV